MPPAPSRTSPQLRAALADLLARHGLPETALHAEADRLRLQGQLAFHQWLNRQAAAQRELGVSVTRAQIAPGEHADLAQLHIELTAP